MTLPVLTRLRLLLDDAERLFRGSYLGYTWLLVLLGAGSVDPRPGAGDILILLLVGLNYHCFGYVHNDLIDLPLDRTQPRRAGDLLVQGRISPPAAWTFALAQIPCSYLLLRLADPAPHTYVVLTTGYAATVLYNVYGKRCPVPMVTDAVQGIAWACLALVGAGIVGGVTALTWIPAGFGFAFVFLINGVHASLRDLHNDFRCGRMTTAIFLGARPHGQEAAVSSHALAVFAYVAFALLLTPVLWLIWAGELPLGSAMTVAMTLWVGVNVVSAFMLWRVVRIYDAKRLNYVYLHQLPLLLPPMVIMLPLLGALLQATLLLCFFLPFALFLPKLRNFAEHLANYPAQPGRSR